MPEQLLPGPAVWILAAVAELYKLTPIGAEPQ